MELHILGCDGGALLEHKPPGFLFDKRFLLDAGTICSALPLEDIEKIDHVFISHSHVDHIKDLGLMADLLTGRRSKPVRIYSTAQVLTYLREHYFNNKIWPDFSSIPQEQPVLELVEIEPMTELNIDGVRFTAIPVNHTIETCGYLISWDGGSFLYSADTGPTELLWEVANQTPDLKGVIIDVAFPSKLQFLADISCHLTPASVAQELTKLNDSSVPIFFFHLKPAFYEQMLQELRPLLNNKRRVLRPGERYKLS